MKPETFEHSTAIEHPRSWLSEASYAYFRALYRRLWSHSAAEPLRVLGVTSCQRGAGVSTVALNLALVAAETSDRSVLLLDLSSTRSSLAKPFGMTGDMGLRDALSGAARPAECARATPVPNLALLGANESYDPSPLNLSYTQVDELLRAVERDFDFAVVDLPPIESNLCFGTARLMHGILLVIEAEGTQSETAARGKQRLLSASANLLGVVLNKHNQHLSQWLETRL